MSWKIVFKLTGNLHVEHVERLVPINKCTPIPRVGDLVKLWDLTDPSTPQYPCRKVLQVEMDFIAEQVTVLMEN